MPYWFNGFATLVVTKATRADSFLSFLSFLDLGDFDLFLSFLSFLDLGDFPLESLLPERLRDRPELEACEFLELDREREPDLERAGVPR